jgi:hypothetical protein
MILTKKSPSSRCLIAAGTLGRKSRPETCFMRLHTKGRPRQNKDLEEDDVSKKYHLLRRNTWKGYAVALAHFSDFTKDSAGSQSPPNALPTLYRALYRDAGVVPLASEARSA